MVAGTVQDVQVVASRAARRLDARNRVLPDFLIIGTQKGGTTSLKKALADHPGAPALRHVGEIGYFDKHYDRGEAWYRSHFPTRRHLDRLAVELGYRPMVGEKTPRYLGRAEVAERVGRDLPDARVVALLRHPIHRAVSHYDMAVAKGSEPNGLLPAFADDLARLDRTLPGVEPPDQRAPRSGFHYLTRGCYADQLEHWWRALGEDRVLVLRSEDFDRAPVATVAQVCRFLDLPELPDLGERRFNVRAGGGRDRERLPGEVWDVLVDVFAEPNRRLRERTGIGWDDWRT